MYIKMHGVLCECLHFGGVNTSLQNVYTFTTPLVDKNADIDYTVYNIFGNQKYTQVQTLITYFTKLLVVKNADTNYTFCRLVFTTPIYIFTLHFYYTFGRQKYFW
jgi:hypothetical protein